MDLGVFDFIILIVIIASAIYGAFKGFISQIVSIASLFVGVWCAFRFSNIVASYIQKVFSFGETAIYIISFIIILLAVMILGNFLGKAIEKIVHLSLLGWMNRLLGILFCSIKTVVILSIIAHMVNYINNAYNLIPDSAFASSKFYPQLINLSEKIFPYLQSLVS